jgi:hypothetical protein
MRMTRLLILVPVLLACGAEREAVSVEVAIHTEADPGVPLAGVGVSAAGSAIGVSDASGMLTASLSGDRGASVVLHASCPAEHREGRVDASVVLRPVFDVTGAARRFDVTLGCPPSSRSGVVVIRAGGELPRAGLAVLLDGREVTTTDASGIAHVSVRMAPGEAFQVELVTATIAPTLRPSNPVTRFSFRDQDEIFLLDQSFDDERPVIAPRGGSHRPSLPPPVTTSRPVEIQSAGSWR